MIDAREWEGRIYEGDCLEFMRGLPEQSVNCCVTSPPYWGLRDYQAEGQLGLEATPEEYIERMVEAFRGVRRVLRDDGTCWLNIGDSYWGGKGQSSYAFQERRESETLAGPQHIIAGMGETRPQDGKHDTLKPKDLCMIPARLALALQADGWWIRSDIIWAKPNPMPESCTDRPTSSHEHVFLLTKAARYWYDADAVREEYRNTSWASDIRKAGGLEKQGPKSDVPGHSVRHGGGQNPSGRNLRNVWTLATEPFPGAHFATYPTKLVAPCIKAGCPHKVCSECGSPWVREVEKDRSFESGSGKSGRDPVGKHGVGLQGGGETRDVRRGPCVTVRTLGFLPTCECGGETEPGVVIDPFAGSGTTGVVAIRHRRRFLGCEINPEYVAMAQGRIDLERDKLQLPFEESVSR